MKWIYAFLDRVTGATADTIIATAKAKGEPTYLTVYRLNALAMRKTAEADRLKAQLKGLQQSHLEALVAAITADHQADEFAKGAA